MRKSILAALLVAASTYMQPVLAALGDVIDTVALGGSSPVGITHDGNGNLYLTDAIDDTVSLINPADGSVISSFSVAVESTGVIGVAVVNGLLLVTDTDDDDVDSYQLDGTYLGSFSVAGATSFPEGIAYSPLTNTLFVIDAGGGANEVEEYAMTGMHLLTRPLAAVGTSPDGLAHDPVHGGFWNYESSSNTMTHYDCDFNVIESFFPDNGAGGEGVAVIGDVLYLVTNSNKTLRSYDISEASTKRHCCPDAPLMGCETANLKDKLKIKSNGKWKAAWVKGNVPTLGNPGIATSYQTCIYVDDGVVGGGFAGAKLADNWKSKGGKAKFKNKLADLQKFLIKKDDVVGKVTAKGVNGPALPLSPVTDVKVQHAAIEAGAVTNCWQSTFSGDEISKDDESKFTAAEKD